MSELTSSVVLTTLVRVGLALSLTGPSAQGHPASECDIAGDGAAGTAVVRSPTPIYQDTSLESRVACSDLIAEGDRVAVEDERAGWSQVRVQDGPCSGRRGWLVTARLDGGGPPQILVGETIFLQTEGTASEQIIDGLASLLITKVHPNGDVRLTLSLPSPYRDRAIALTLGSKHEFDYRSHRYRIMIADQPDFANQSARVRLDRLD